jgi:lysophospholipase L1-like esterase
VFLGDSITEQRLYTTYIEAYTLTRFPRWNLTFRNVGWGGDTSWLRQRAHPDEGALFAADAERQQAMVEDSVKRGLERDVLPLRPTVVTIKFGMNDHSYQPFREDIFRAYVRSQNRLGEVLAGAGARVAFLTPQPIEEKRADPDKDVRNVSLRKFSDGLKEVAARRGALFVDQFDPYMGLMLRERSSNPEAFIGGGDAVHPGPAGQTLMAWAVLKGLGAGALVSRVEIDGAAQKVKVAERCKVENLKVAGGAVAFVRIDEALPMPVDVRAEAALKLAPVLDELSRYELRITGLAPGDYEVKIDGEVVGKVAGEALANGWNLANDSGPITRQSRKVLELVFQKNDVFFRRWREVQLFALPAWAQNPASDAGRKVELAALDQRIADLEGQVNAARQPGSHHFEVTPAAR